MAMRTTLTLDDDVVAAVEKIRRRDGIAISEAVNRLVRAGMARRPERPQYVHRTHRLGLKVDITNIGEVLGMLDDER